MLGGVLVVSIAIDGLDGVANRFLKNTNATAISKNAAVTMLIIHPMLAVAVEELEESVLPDCESQIDSWLVGLDVVGMLVGLAEGNLVGAMEGVLLGRVVGTLLGAPVDG
jgi:hypothetical protein